MRFQVTYKAEWLPIKYRMKVYSLIKEAVRQADEGYYQKLFELEKREIKPFSSSVFLRDFRFSDDKILLKEFTITLSSTMEFAVHAFNGLRKLQTYEVEGVTWTQTSIQLLKEAEICTNSVYLQTLSPILIEDKQGKPLSPDDGAYETELNYFANLQIKQIADRKLHQPIHFTPVQMKKMVVRESNRFFNQTHQGKSLYFTTYRGLFKLEGHRDDLQLLYQLGIGKRTAFFGLTEYVREEV